MSTRLALLLAASLACNHIPDEQGGIPTPNTLENFPDQFMLALCTSFLDCPPPAMGTCRGALAPGAPCAASDTCAEGGGCVAEGGRSVCVVPTFATAVGDACGPGVSASRCDPLAGLRCEAGRCAAVRDASGAPGCDWQNPWGQCPVGQICRRATSRCEAPLAEGAACNVDPECANGWCDRSGPTPRCVRGTC